MELQYILEQEKASIVKEWFDLLVKTYPPDSSSFLKNKKDHFANPVGSTFSESLNTLFEGLVNGADREGLIASLDPVIRIRAVQDFSPSQANSFILSLKEIVRKKVKKKINDDKLAYELLTFESRIDELSLLAFDIYMGCREQLYNIKANQEKSKVFKAFKRAGLITEVSEDKPDLKAGTKKD